MTLPAIAGHRSRLPGFNQCRPPENKGRRYPADPPTVEEIIAVMRVTGHTQSSGSARCSVRRASGDAEVGPEERIVQRLRGLGRWRSPGWYLHS
jgi:hypothetical protein